MRDRTVERCVEGIGDLFPSSAICLAFSGGVDSTVLLHALKSANISFSAYHVNHGLSPNAKAWALHATQQCQALGVPITCLTLASKPGVGESIEAWARQARYAALINALPLNSVLLTAHHENDQAETFLLQLMRGAGPKGLSSMAPLKMLCRRKNILLHRPFLSLPKQAIDAYAKEHGLSWMDDESNAHLRFDRNFMRQEVLPVMATRFAHAVTSVAQSAKYMQEQQGLIDLLLTEKMPVLSGCAPGTLSITKLLALPEILLKAVLRYWMDEHGVRMPSPQKLETLMSSVLKADQSAHPQVCMDSHVVVRYRDTLYIVSKEQLRPLSDYRFEWDPREPLILPHGAGVLSSEDLSQAGVVVPEGEKITISFRRGGEKVFIAGVGHQSLKKWFQARDIPVWERNRIPLVGIKTVLPLLR